MTREVAKKLVPMVQAFADGKTIQYYDGGAIWKDIENPAFTGDISNYRIKPELRVIRLVERADGVLCYFEPLVPKKVTLLSGERIIEFIEVINPQDLTTKKSVVVSLNMKLILEYFKIFFWMGMIGGFITFDIVVLFEQKATVMEALRGGCAVFTVVMLNGIITSPLYWLAFREKQ